MKGIVIFGSARSNGNSRKILDQFLDSDPTLTIVDLNEKNISYFDYSHSNQNDDFIPLIEEILKYDFIIFLTPVYWYSMSAVLKTFFDRISDLLTIRKDLGRQLRGKTAGSVSCGSGGGIDAAFSYPFRGTATYLGMEYIGHLHTWLDGDGVSESVAGSIDTFLKQPQIAKH